MSLSQRTIKKFEPTLRLFVDQGQQYISSQEYLAEPNNFLPLDDFLSLTEVLFNRFPDQAVRFDTDIMRGVWGVLLQKRMGRKEIRLIVPFKALSWTGRRRYLTRNEIDNFAVIIATTLAISERFNEEEYKNLLEALQESQAIWCLDAGDSFASLMAALAQEQAWEQISHESAELVNWWVSLASQDKDVIVSFIHSLWSGAEMDEMAVAREFYSFAAAINTRWSASIFLDNDLPLPIVKLVNQEIFHRGGLTRPTKEMTALELAESFGEKSNGDFIKILQDSLVWFGHLPTGLHSLTLFAANTEQLSAMINSVFNTDKTTAVIFKNRLMLEHKAVTQAKAEWDDLLSRIEVPVRAEATRKKREISPQLKLLLAKPFFPPVLAPRANFKLPYLSPELDSRMQTLSQEFLASLQRLWYLWFSLIERMRRSRSDFVWLAAICKSNPLWDFKADQVVSYIKKNIVDLVDSNIDLPLEIERLITSASWFKLHDGEINPYMNYSDNFFSRCAQSLEQSEVIFKDFGRSVGELVRSYQGSVSQRSRAAFERLRFVGELKLPKLAETRCLTILGWYDELLQLQDEYNKAQEAWQEIDAYFETSELIEFAEEKEVSPIIQPQSADFLPAVMKKGEPLAVVKPETKEKINASVENSTLNKTEETANLLDVSNGSIELPQKVFKDAMSTSSVAIRPEIQIGSSEFIYPSPQVLKSIRPAFVFDLEDEKEADKHRSKIKSGEEKVILEKQIRTFIDEVIEKKNLVFRDEINKRRFVQLMVSRLKDVRGPLEVVEVLSRPIEQGGLGMNEEKTEQVKEIIESAKREFEEKRKNQQLQIPEPLAETLLPPEPVRVIPPKPITNTEATRQQWREQILKEIETQSPEPVASQRSVLPPKPQLVDVKAPPKVIGPLEELRTLTLVDFRRLGGTPQEALQKIKSKIDLLGENSISRRVEAVRAWKSSVVYQQYLRLGRESIEQGKTIGTIVGAHQAQGDAVLTEEEFNAIADFNSQLRF